MTPLKITAASALLGAAMICALPDSAMAATASPASTAINRLTRQLQQQASGRAIAFGSLTATGTNSATIATPDSGSLTVNLAQNTKFIGHTQAAAAEGYKTGDQVLVIGTYRNGFLGTSVTYDTTAFPVPGVERIAGKVSVATAQSLTLALSGNKTSQVQLGTLTRYFVNGAAVVAAPAFSANETVTVLAQEQTDGTFVARIVALGSLQANPSAARIAGTIMTVASDNASFTLKLANGKTATVTISPTTKFQVNGQAVTTAPTLTPNERVVVQGARSTDASGTITIAATLIIVRTSG